MQLNEILRQVSRTFALSAEELPEILRQPLTISYLLLRISDILEDHPEMSPDRKARLLRTWAAILAGEAAVAELIHNVQDLDPSDPEVYVAHNADYVINELAKLPEGLRVTVKERVIESSLGMARW